jgi:hypothetical protein
MAYDLPILTVSRNSILNSTPVGILSHQFYAAYLNSKVNRNNISGLELL